MSPGCSTCTVNLFEIGLWAIWMQRADEWGLLKGTNTYNHRFSAASCWQHQIGPLIEARPCSTACCITRYNVSRTSMGRIYADFFDPVQFSNNCVEQPCSYYECDKVPNMELDEFAAEELELANPGFLGGLSKENKVNIKKESFVLQPNPAENKVKIIMPIIENDKQINAINVHNLFGEKLISISYNPLTIQDELEIDVSNLSNGIYYITIHSYPKIIFTEKLIITK